MSLRAWLLVLASNLALLLAGGFAFRALEEGADCERQREEFSRAKELREAARGIMGSLPSPHDRSELQELLGQLEVALGSGPSGGYRRRRTVPQFANLTTNEGGEEGECVENWTLYNSVFFTFCLVTTIGYGHIGPATDGGKWLCIFYFFVGIPLNAILVAGIVSAIKKGHKSMFRAKGGDGSKGTARLAAELIVYVAAGVTFFLLAPAAAFRAIQDGWSYLDGFYFSINTLTTVGLGDLVSGTNQDVLGDMEGGWDVVYEVAVIVWVTLGMAYAVEVLWAVEEFLMRRPAKKAAKKLATRASGDIREIVNSANQS